MEDPANRNLGNTIIESYHLKRKREREELAIQQDNEALEVLNDVKKYYEENYPNSKYGIEYEEKKEKLAKPTFDGLSREEAINLRNALKYFKSEHQTTISNEKQVGHCIWRVSQSIPDLSKILKLEVLLKKRQEIDEEMFRLKNLKEELQKPIESPKVFTCNWCGKKFEGETARIEIKEHILKCPKRPEAPEEEAEREKEPERIFTCHFCGFKANREKIIEHSKTCREKEIPKETEEKNEFICPVEGCGKDCKNGAGLSSHMKTHEKE